MKFSEPSSDWKVTGIKVWASVCMDSKGALYGPTKKSVQRQIEYWSARPQEWAEWVKSVQLKE